MKWVMFLIIIAMLSSVLGKQDEIIKRIEDKKSDDRKNNKENSIPLESYINKKVSIEIDNDDISNAHLFSSMYNTTGEIINYDSEWLEFRYKDKSKNKLVNKFFRVRDIVSINEIE